jgi:Transposase DDE domain
VILRRLIVTALRLLATTVTSSAFASDIAISGRDWHLAVVLPRVAADQRVMELLRSAGKTAVIPPRSNRKTQHTYDKAAYKARHLIENFYCKLKQFRAIATRYDKTARNFLAAIHLAAAGIWLN